MADTKMNEQDYLEKIKGSQKIWLTSYTVDEAEAWALLYQALDGQVGTEKVTFRYHQGAFRRAGNAGVMPRSVLCPHKPKKVRDVNVLPTYHPKLLLAKHRNDQYTLIVATANIAADDFRNTRNLAASIDFRKNESDKIDKIIEWIEGPPEDHRALVVHVRNRKKTILAPEEKNSSTLDQIIKKQKKCKGCIDSPKWIIASPFWSRSALARILNFDMSANKGAKVTAYFRAPEIAQKIVRDDWRRNVKAYSLVADAAGGDARWHHKVLAWRCCDGADANALLYLGSANATACGMAGIQGKAINWEAGILWERKASTLWKQAEKAAKAGFKRKEIRIANNTDGVSDGEDKECGPDETSEWRQQLTAYVASMLDIDIKKRTLKINQELPSYGVKSIKVFAEAVTDSGVKIVEKRHGNAGFHFAEKERAYVAACFEDGRQIRLDLIELDPEPERPRPSQADAMRLARQRLQNLSEEDTSKTPRGRKKRESVSEPSRPAMPSRDIRFPFADYFKAAQKTPEGARRWLESVSKPNNELGNIPAHWRPIAGRLLLDSKDQKKRGKKS